MLTKHIKVENFIATYNKDDGVIVCANSKYKVEFAFDDIWNEYETKKARFTVFHNGRYESIDVEFKGNTCPVPPLYNTKFVEVGVFIDGGISTTTSAVIECAKSALCGKATSRYSPEEIKALNEALKGENGLTPFIGENGNWWIGDTDTGVNAQGGSGGGSSKDGLTPFIGANGNWWIGEEDTGVQAEGKDGRTPMFWANVHSADGKQNTIDFMVRYSDDEDWQFLYSIKDGKDGKTPIIRMSGTDMGGYTEYDVYVRYGEYGQEEGIGVLRDGKTPVRGTDYWTPADKAEIKSYVDAQIESLRADISSAEEMISLINEGGLE